MDYSLNGICYMLDSAIKRARESERIPDEIRDSALLNYVKQWLEWRYFDLHQREVQVDDVFLTFVNEPVPQTYAKLVVKFEVKIRDTPESDARWVYGKIHVALSLGKFTTSLDSKLETCLITTMEKWISQADPNEYVAPADFLDIQL